LSNSLKKEKSKPCLNKGSKIIDTSLNYRLAQKFYHHDFLADQKQSFKTFLRYGLIKTFNTYGFFSTGLKQELSKAQKALEKPEQLKPQKKQPPKQRGGKITSTSIKSKAIKKEHIKSRCDVIFHGAYYRLKKPNLTPKQALLSGQTYTAALYVPIQFIMHPTKPIFTDWFLIGHLPMMTEKGHFIINGSPRIILSQMVRRPGIYFQKVHNKHDVYIADFIAQRGTWLRLETSAKDQNHATGKIWAKIKRLKKCPVSVILTDLGCQSMFFNQYLRPSSQYFKNNAMFKNTLLARTKHLETFLNQVMESWSAEFYSQQGYFRHKFTDCYVYNLSRSGRANLNKTLGLNFPLSQTTLTAEDILVGCFHLIEFVHGNYKPSDIDDLSHRKVQSVGELLENQMGIGLNNLRKFLTTALERESEHLSKFWQEGRNKITDVNNLNHKKQDYFKQFISPRPINAVLKKFFGTNALSQFLDQINPLSDLTHKRRISSLGDGGVKRETAGMDLRGIHPSHFSRICPIETPEGQNAGLVNSLTCYSRSNRLGILESPFYPVYKGCVLRDQTPIMFSSDQEKTHSFCSADARLDKFDCLGTEKHQVRLFQNFQSVDFMNINWMAISPLQMISVATSLIPFLEHDDGNRALMGSNMQRQAVPPLIPTAPIVGTGFESDVISDSCYGIQAKYCGFVSYVDNQKVIVYGPNMIETKLPLNNFIGRLQKQSQNKKDKNSKSKFASTLSAEFTTISETYTSKGCDFYGLKVFPVSKMQKPLLLNSFSFNQKQLHRLLTETFFTEQRSLWQMLVYLSNLQGKLTTRGVRSIVSGTTLNFLEQCQHSMFLRHYCLLGLYEMFFNTRHWSWSSLTSVCLLQNLCQNPSLLLNADFCSSLSAFEPQSYLSSEKDDSLYHLTKNHAKVGGSSKNRQIDFAKTNQVTKQAKRFHRIKIPRIRQPVWQSIDKKKLFNRPGLKSQAMSFCNDNSLPPFIVYQQRLLTPFRIGPTTETLGATVTTWFSDLFPRMGQIQFDMPENFLSLDVAKSVQNFCQNDAVKKTVKANLAHQPMVDPSFAMPLYGQKVKPKKHAQNLSPKTYWLDDFRGSNQGTVLAHRPSVIPGQWVEKGDLLANNRVSDQGELAIGQNLLVGYTPWEGYNFEDAVLLNQRVIYEDLFTTLHIESYEITLKDTAFGLEKITKNLPGEKDSLCHLDKDGIVKIGTWVEEGQILIGKITPIQPRDLTGYELLMYDLIEQEPQNIKNTSLRVPKDINGRVIHIERIYQSDNTEQITEQIAEQTSEQPFEDQSSVTFPLAFENVVLDEVFMEKLSSRTVFRKSPKQKTLLNKTAFKQTTGIPKTSSWLLLQKRWHLYKPHFLTKTLGLKTLLSMKSEKQINLNKQSQSSHPASDQKAPKLLNKVRVYMVEKRKIQVGDKMAGRHGNKGIVSTILPRQDMPYLPDGTILDLVLNPLGVPSRMNVGQIFECLLGFAGSYLNQAYKIQPFDETYGSEASRSLVYSKLYEARLKTCQSWLFNPDHPGKVRLFDGRTGQCFAQPVTVGKAYILKLIHLVDEKIHARSTGPYALITQQPLRGRSNEGGQRVGEMEVWAFEGFGAAYLLQELLTIKSDDLLNRPTITSSIIANKSFNYGFPESFNVLIRELQGLCLNITVGKKQAIPLITRPKIFLDKSPKVNFS
jgi:DNA-directed RNA polymerase beta subunit